MSSHKHRNPGISVTSGYYPKRVNSWGLPKTNNWPAWKGTYPYPKLMISLSLSLWHWRKFQTINGVSRDCKGNEAYRVWPRVFTVPVGCGCPWADHYTVFTLYSEAWFGCLCVSLSAQITRNEWRLPTAPEAKGPDGEGGWCRDGGLRAVSLTLANKTKLNGEVNNFFVLIKCVCISILKHSSYSRRTNEWQLDQLGWPRLKT